MRLGVKCPGHAYKLPEGAEVWAAARAAKMSGGVLCVVQEREVVVSVELDGKVIGCPMLESVWVPVAG